MAAYAYKYVRDLLPDYLTNDVEGYEGDPGYNGDQWYATSHYIHELEAEIAAQYKETQRIHNEKLYLWLKNREETLYSLGPVL